MTKQHLYFIYCPTTGLVKIGKATHVRSRLSQIQTGCPTELEVLAVIRYYGDLEETIHKDFRHLNTRGEWFIFTKEIDIFIDELLHRYEIVERGNLSNI